MRNTRVFVLLVGLFLCQPSRGQGDGLYATIATSMGEVRVQLEYEKAPVTVSNFVGLAEGTRTAVNSSTGAIPKGGFYDGTIIHRVVKNFVIQGGSRDGEASSGPGYSFQDEFHPDLTHDEPFVISMANSGINTNGSQFFITVTPQPDLNNKHSVFGKVVEGADVATAISEMATQSGSSRPVTDVVIETVTIDRVGADARLFDASAVELPKVSASVLEWDVKDGQYFLDLNYQRNSSYTLYESEDLVNWRSRLIGFYLDTVVAPIEVTSSIQSDKRQFFRVIEVVYPTVIFPPNSLTGKTLELEITEFEGRPTKSSMSYRFASETDGKAKFGSSAEVPLKSVSYALNSPTSATLILISDLLRPFDLVQLFLNFASATTGGFRAGLPNGFNGGSSMAGSFTLNPS